jgi:digeranylgeranylglycerophospholipid reductase
VWPPAPWGHWSKTLLDSHYDIIVVGAGPAGSMAAMHAARGGAKTLLLEKHEQVGLPVCCAEGITTAGLESVIKPRPDWISTTIRGARLEGPSGMALTFLHPNAGYVLNREVFDAGLAQMAVDAGVDLATSSPVVGVNHDGEYKIKSVFISSETGRTEIFSRIVIAADGVESRVAYMAGIDTTVALDDIDSACQYVVKNAEVDSGIINIIIGNEIAPGGYAWVFPKSNDTANIGLAVCPSKANGKTARDYLNLFIAERFPASERIKTVMGVLPTYNRNLPLVYGNLMLIGDAARLLDSLSGAGISNALLSGSIAGKVAAACLKGEGDIKDYATEFMSLKRRELYAYKLFRSMFVKTSDNEFEDILKSIDGLFPIKKVRAVNVPDIIFKLIFRNPGLMKMARYLIAK